MVKNQRKYSILKPVKKGEALLDGGVFCIDGRIEENQYAAPFDSAATAHPELAKCVWQRHPFGEGERRVPPLFGGIRGNIFLACHSK